MLFFISSWTLCLLSLIFLSLMQQMMPMTRMGNRTIQSRIGMMTWVGLAEKVELWYHLFFTQEVSLSRMHFLWLLQLSPMWWLIRQLIRVNLIVLVQHWTSWSCKSASQYNFFSSCLHELFVWIRKSSEYWIICWRHSWLKTFIVEFSLATSELNVESYHFPTFFKDCDQYFCWHNLFLLSCVSQKSKSALNKFKS